jgi:nucleotide-binding universal stress UspA family protein
MPGSVARLASLLVPTDLSEIGNQAVDYAYATVSRGGRIRLLHVIEEAELPNPLYAHYTPGRCPTAEERALQTRSLERDLRALVPTGASELGILTEVEIVAADDPAQAIARAADAAGVDAICMATHGRTGLSELVAGSIAGGVAKAYRRTLILVRPARSD